MNVNDNVCKLERSLLWFVTKLYESSPRISVWKVLLDQVLKRVTVKLTICIFFYRIELFKGFKIED